MPARRDDFSAGQTKGGVANQMARDSVNLYFRDGVFGKTFERQATSLRYHGSSARAFEGEAAELFGDVAQRDIVHDDEFIQRRDGAFAHRSVREHQQFVL